MAGPKHPSMPDSNNIGPTRRGTLARLHASIGTRHDDVIPCMEATLATRAWDPSPPAMPITSAPRATASSATWTRSSPGDDHRVPH